MKITVVLEGRLEGHRAGAPALAVRRLTLCIPVPPGHQARIQPAGDCAPLSLR